MTDSHAGANATAGASAGQWLRSAREAAGLSIDAVAQQLKLAPRQVKALEDDNFADLPGRTFVRGFVRNYARLLHLDPAAVVGALPLAEAAPALEGPALGSSSRPMGELPTTPGRRGGAWSRWAIPVALAAAVIVAAVYEYLRPDQARIDKAPARAASDPVAPVPPAGTPLPNPAVAGAPRAEAGATPAPAAESAPAPSTPITSAPSPGATASTAAAAPPPAAAAAPAAAPAPAGEAVLVIHYRAQAWTQVRDATGQVLLVANGEPGGSQTVRGRPPLDLVLGNADDARITWRGQPFDLAPHVKANVARVRLQ